MLFILGASNSISILVCDGKNLATNCFENKQAKTNEWMNEWMLKALQYEAESITQLKLSTLDGLMCNVCVVQILVFCF